MQDSSREESGTQGANRPTWEEVHGALRLSEQFLHRWSNGDPFTIYAQEAHRRVRDVVERLERSEA